MKKSKFLLALVLVLCVSALAGGATLALFTANTTGSNDVDVQAGKLEIVSFRDNGDHVPGPMFYVTPLQGRTTDGTNEDGDLPTDVWAPGDTNERTLIVENKGSAFDGQSSLDAWLDSVQAQLAPGSDPTLADKLWVEVTSNRDTAPLVAVKVAEGHLSDFLSGTVPLRYVDNSAERPSLNTNSLRPLNFKVTFEADAGNTYQNSSLVVDFLVNGVQKANNP